MRLFRVEAEPGSEIEFKTDITDWEDLPQIKDGYVVHARCFIIDGDVWIDHYNLMVSLDHWWKRSLSQKYDYDSYKNDDVIAFQISASEAISVVHPTLDEDCGRQKWCLGRFLEEMGANEDTKIHWGEGDITFGDMIINEG
ncbi:MAG: hypothetical protein ABEH81_01125 [Halopenitus sp.]